MKRSYEEIQTITSGMEEKLKNGVENRMKNEENDRRRKFQALINSNDELDASNTRKKSRQGAKEKIQLLVDKNNDDLVLAMQYFKVLDHHVASEGLSKISVVLKHDTTDVVKHFESVQVVKTLSEEELREITQTVTPGKSVNLGPDSPGLYFAKGPKDIYFLREEKEGTRKTLVPFKIMHNKFVEFFALISRDTTDTRLRHLYAENWVIFWDAGYDDFLQIDMNFFREAGYYDLQLDVKDRNFLLDFKKQLNFNEVKINSKTYADKQEYSPLKKFENSPQLKAFYRVIFSILYGRPQHLLFESYLRSRGFDVSISKQKYRGDGFKGTPFEHSAVFEWNVWGDAPKEDWLKSLWSKIINLD